jgi:CPA2 family monovalent cation:H+ antiporter-2
VNNPEAYPYLREALLFLALTGILIPLLQRLRINQVLGFLAAGVLVGPFGLGLWTERLPWLAYFSFPHREDVTLLGELGVLFLMFMIGLELSAERLWSLRRWVFGAGSAQVVASAAIIGAVAWWFGHGVPLAVILGGVLSLSSTAVAMQLMAERRTLGTPLGQASFSILMLQDLAVVPLLILIGVLGRGSGEGALAQAGFTLLKSVGVVALIWLLGQRVIRPLFRTFAQRRQPEIFMALTLLTTLGIAALTQAVGLSPALGAFLAGLLLAETEFRHEVEVNIEPFKGLLMALFFMSVGMGIDLRTLAQAPLWLPLSVAGLFAIKGAVLAPILRIGGFSWGRAVEGAALLGQGGEFVFIAVGYASMLRLLDAATAQFILLVVSLSLFATPVVARAGRSFGDWWERRHPPPAGDLRTAEPQATQVIIAGFGRVGQLAAQLLEANGIHYVALESDARLVSHLHAQGVPIYFGDAARADLLRKLHAEQAQAILLTMDHPSSALHAVRAIRREFPMLPLIARSRDEKHALALRQAGATVVIPETLESGLQLSASVLRALGIGESEAERQIQRARERRIAELEPVSAAEAKASRER